MTCLLPLLPTPRTMKICLYLVLLFLLAFNCSLFAQGDLLITPRRIVFDASQRSEDIHLANIGKDTATYTISFMQIRMHEDGRFESITQPDSGQFFADKHLRIFPRTVTLAPNETQVIKMQVVKRGEMVTGEYRSHIYFRALKNDKPLGDTTSAKDSTISIKLVPVYGISIPAIIRVGETSASAAISDPTFAVEADTIPIVKATLNREGNQSVYGDIAVEHISPLGKITRVANIQGVAVYTPTTKREIKLQLNPYAGADLASGKLKITYSDQSAKNNILAQSEISLD